MGESLTMEKDVMTVSDCGKQLRVKIKVFDMFPYVATGWTEFMQNETQLWLFPTQ